MSDKFGTDLAAELGGAQVPIKNYLLVYKSIDVQKVAIWLPEIAADLTVASVQMVDMNLSADQRTQITRWLATQSQPSVAALASYIQTQFGVVYRSSQSYYTLLAQAGYRWKKPQARSPKADPH